MTRDRRRMPHCNEAASFDGGVRKKRLRRPLSSCRNDCQVTITGSLRRGELHHSRDFPAWRPEYRMIELCTPLKITP